MRCFKSVTNFYIKRRFRRIAEHLREVPPGKLQNESESRLYHCLQHAAREVPAYQRLLQAKNVDAEKISSIEEFREEIPVLNKQNVFQRQPLHEWTVNGTLKQARLLYSSSGYSGVFSYGLESKAQIKHAARSFEFALTTIPEIVEEQVLLINCLPSGVEIHTESIPMIRSSVREDVVLALVDKLRPYFRQLIILGEHLFLKKLFEEGNRQKIGWEDFFLCVVTGGEYIAKNAADYLRTLAGIDPDHSESGQLIVSFGLSELSSSICRETWETSQIRRLAFDDMHLREMLYGEETHICPSIMQYNPYQNYIETVKNEEGREQLVVSMLEPKRMVPLIRYNTGDTARIISFDALEQIMCEYGRPDLVPEFRLPFVVTWGKYEPLNLANQKKVYPESVKEALYADQHVAEAITGNFRLQRCNGDKPEVLVQLKPAVPTTADLQKQLLIHLKEWAGEDVSTTLIPYQDYPFGMTLDYERKPQYV